MRFVGFFICFAVLWLPSISLATVHDISFPKTELDKAKAAIEAIRKDKPEHAIELKNSVRDETLKRVIEWAIYKSPGSPVSAQSIVDFAKKNPTWPAEDTLLERAEDALAKSHSSDTKSTTKFFENYPPQSAIAKWKFAQAIFKQNKQSKQAVELLKQAWQSAKLNRSDAKDFLNQHKKDLSEKDHIARISNLLWENKISAANDIMHLVPKAYRTLFNARIALQQSSYGVDSAVSAVPANLVNDAGFLYDRIRWREKKDLYSGAISLLKQMKDSGKHPYSSLWWNMRKRLVREALEHKEYSNAYHIVSNHNAIEGGVEFAESEWLSGWIATRFLHKPRKGYEHFFKMYHHVNYPISLARASYWAARTAEINGNADIAQRWYKVAAEHPITFYGQLAVAKLSKKPTLTLPSTAEPSRDDLASYKNSSLVRAIHALMQMKEHGLAKDFMLHSIENTNSSGLKNLIGQIGEYYDQPFLSVYTARTAANTGTPLIRSGYPILPLDYRMHCPRELAHAITLQESRFEPTATSHAGAQGLMQLMPETARRMSRDLRLNYHRSKLIYDPEYNVQLGSGYLKHLLNVYDNTPILAIAAYNAGPGNVRKWLRTYGDPREFKSVEEVIDWMEMIPFSETRNYVQRVIENMQLYRRLSGNELLEIEQDIKPTH